MSLSTILAAIGGLSALVGGIVYLVKLGFFAFHTTPAQTDQQIDQTVESNKQSAEQSGRPV